MIPARSLLNEIRALPAMMPTMGKALTSTGLLADLFGMSKNATSRVAMFGPTCRCDKPERKVNGGLTILARCIFLLSAIAANSDAIVRCKP